jgi:hypothetical protein
MHKALFRDEGPSLETSKFYLYILGCQNRSQSAAFWCYCHNLRWHLDRSSLYRDYISYNCPVAVWCYCHNLCCHRPFKFISSLYFIQLNCSCMCVAAFVFMYLSGYKMPFWLLNMIHLALIHLQIHYSCHWIVNAVKKQF